MKKTSQNVLWFLFTALTATAQDHETIRFARNFAYTYFFQKGEPSDTIGKNHGDEFYLLAPDSLKDHLYIFVENGKLSFLNDSLVLLTYLPGLKYETRFLPDERGGTEKLQLRTFMNGTSVLPRNQLKVQLVDKYSGKALMEDRYIFRPD